MGFGWTPPARRNAMPLTLTIGVKSQGENPRKTLETLVESPSLLAREGCQLET